MTASTTLVSRHNSLRTAYTFGQLILHQTPEGTQITRSIDCALGHSKLVNYYSFTAQRTFNLRASLTNCSGPAILRLLYPGPLTERLEAGDVIMVGPTLLNGERSLQIEGLGAGTYYLEVSPIGQTPNPYTLSLTAVPGIPSKPTPTAARTPADAVAIVGQLKGTREFRGQFYPLEPGSDFYRFTLTQTIAFRGKLSAENPDLSLRLYHDANRKGRLEAAIAWSKSIGAAYQVKKILRHLARRWLNGHN